MQLKSQMLVYFIVTSASSSRESTEAHLIGTQANAEKYCNRKNSSLPNGITKKEVEEMKSWMEASEEEHIWLSIKNRNKETSVPSRTKKDAEVNSPRCGFLMDNGMMGSENCWKKLPYFCSDPSWHCPLDQNPMEEANWFQAQRNCISMNLTLVISSPVKKCHPRKLNKSWVDEKSFRYSFPSGNQVSSRDMLWGQNISDSALGQCIVITKQGFWEPRDCHISTEFLCSDDLEREKPSHNKESCKKVEATNNMKHTYYYVYIVGSGAIICLLACVVFILLRKVSGIKQERDVVLLRVGESTVKDHHEVQASSEGGQAEQWTPSAHQYGNAKRTMDGYVGQVCCPGKSQLPFIKNLQTGKFSRHQVDIVCKDKEDESVYSEPSMTNNE